MIELYHLSPDSVLGQVQNWSMRTASHNRHSAHVSNLVLPCSKSVARVLPAFTSRQLYACLLEWPGT
jgi:hypothetical protein